MNIWNEIQPYVITLIIQAITLVIVFLKTKKSSLLKKLDEKIDWSSYDLEIDGKTYNLSQFKIKKRK